MTYARVQGSWINGTGARNLTNAMSTRTLSEVPISCQDATDELVAEYIRHQFFPPIGVVPLWVKTIRDGAQYDCRNNR